jgi:hypothetical protein
LSLDDCRKPSMKMINAFSLDTSPLCADTCAFAERELRETPEQVQKSLAELRELLKGKSKTSTSVPEAILRVGVGNDDWFAVISTSHRYYKLKDTKHPTNFRFRSKSVLILQQSVFFFFKFILVSKVTFSSRNNVFQS